MELVEGKIIAASIYEDLKKRIGQLGFSPTLFIFYAGESPASESFVKLKQKMAGKIGVTTKVFRFGKNVDEKDILESIKSSVNAEKCNGIIVQLPLPKHINTDLLINSVPTYLDVDVLSKEANRDFAFKRTNLLPAVVGAVAKVFDFYKITFLDKKVAIVGKGRLVGKPLFNWFLSLGIDPLLFDEVSGLSGLIEADIVISGTGVPHLIKPEMVKEGVVLIDAGTSEDSGEIRGDVDPLCAKKSRLFSPVPGGLGPITVAMLFQNLIVTSEAQKRGEK